MATITKKFKKNTNYIGKQIEEFRKKEVVKDSDGVGFPGLDFSIDKDAKNPNSKDFIEIKVIVITLACSNTMEGLDVWDNLKDTVV